MGADLKYLVDARTALLDMLGLRAPSDFFTTDALNRILNRGFKFVEQSTKSNQETTGFRVMIDKFRYSLADSISQNGVDAVFFYPAETGSKLEPLGLSYKPMKEFGRLKGDDIQAYTLWDNVLYITKPPADDYDSLFAFTYKVTGDLTTDSAIVPLPIGWKRELAVLYAFKLCAESQQNDTKATRIWNEIKEQWQMQTGTELKEPENVNEENA
jgi:hypothetical protein